MTDITDIYNAAKLVTRDFGEGWQSKIDRECLDQGRGGYCIAGQLTGEISGWTKYENEYARLYPDSTRPSPFSGRTADWLAYLDEYDSGLRYLAEHTAGLPEAIVVDDTPAEPADLLAELDRLDDAREAAMAAYVEANTAYHTMRDRVREATARHNL